MLVRRAFKLMTVLFVLPTFVLSSAISAQEHEHPIPEKLGVVKFPTGESIQKLQFGSQRLDAATNPRYLLLRPIQKYALGVLDLRTLQLRQVLPIGSDPDVLAFDPALGRLYVAAESGVVAMFEERDGLLGQLGWYRAPRANTVAVDPTTHRVYLPLANVSGHPVLRVLVPSDSH